jgi:CRISPR/Cas system-associated exonuclease Cas4 (RecB family)
MRAKNVNIIYSVSKNGSLGGKSEQSRIVNQLQYDLLAKNKNIDLSFNPVSFGSDSKSEENKNAIIIQKTPAILAKIREEISSENRGLSPSSITQYFRCSLQFYFAKILKLQTEDEIEDSFAHNVFGNWIHETLEKIAEEYFGLKSVIKQDGLLEAKKKVKHYLQKVFDEKYKGYEKEKGWNHIYWTMAISLLEQFFEQKGVRLANSEMSYLAAEEKLTATIYSADLGIGIRLKGLIDAIELEGEKLSLVDYKTGKAELNDLKPSGKDTPLETFLKDKKDKYRQLLIYLYLFEKNQEKFPQTTDLVAKIYSFRDLSKEIEMSLASKEVIEIVEEGLKHIAISLLDENNMFTQTDDYTICQNCDFKSICNR